MRAVDEEMLGSWASITANLIKSVRSNALNMHTEVANALESIADAEGELAGPIQTSSIPAIATFMTVSTRTHTFFFEIPQIELDFTTSLVMEERVIEIPGRYTPFGNSIKTKTESSTRPTNPL